MEPRTSNIRREAPIPRPEGNDDDDDDPYPDFNFGTQPSKDNKTVSEQATKSMTINPTAPVMGPETAATGVTTSPMIVMEERASNTWPTPIYPIPQPSLGPTMNQPLAASSSLMGSQAHCHSQDRGAFCSPDRNRRERQSPSWTRYHSSTQTANPHHRYQHSLSPY